jgi:hypothetical protein
LALPGAGASGMNWGAFADYPGVGAMLCGLSFCNLMLEFNSLVLL